jgi:hypothetical protein
VFRLRRDTGGLDGVRTSKETIHGVVNLGADLAGPQHLNAYARGHWCVENRLHWNRDVTFREDESQLRTGTGPRALASFRNLALNAFRLAGRANIAHARRDLHDRADTFAVYCIYQTMIKPDTPEQRRGRAVTRLRNDPGSPCNPPTRHNTC